MTSDPERVDQSPTDAQTAAPSRRLELIAAAAALLLFTALLVLASQLELRREPVPGQIDARQWPVMLGALGIVLALARLAVSWLRPAEGRDDLEPIRPGGYGRLVVTLVLTLGYVAVWAFREQLSLGVPVFLLVTPLFLAALVATYGARNWKPLVLFPVLLTGFAYLLFGALLRIPL